MKKLFFLFLISNFAFSQFGVGNKNTTVEFYIIKRSNNPYGRTISTVRDAERSGQVQSELQKRYDINDEKIRNAISHINEEISNIDYPEEVINKINIDFREYVKTINKYFQNNKNAILNNSLVDSLINNLYINVNSSIKKIITEYENTLINTSEKANEYLKKHLGNYKVKIEEIKMINNNWTVLKTEYGFVNIDLQKISFLKEGAKEGGYRELIFNTFDKTEDCIVFYSIYGLTFMKSDFSIIYFTDINGDNFYFKYTIIEKI